MAARSDGALKPAAAPAAINHPAASFTTVDLRTMVLIETVPDGAYGCADKVFVIPDAYRARYQG